MSKWSSVVRDKVEAYVVSTMQEERKIELLDNLSIAVEQVQNEFDETAAATLHGGESIKNLCDSVSDILHHGLKEKLASTSKGKTSFWPVIEKLCLKEDVQTIYRLPITQSDSNRCYAWIRMALKEHTIGSYLSMLLDDTKLLRDCYQYFAFMRDPVKVESVKTLFQYVISAVDFNIDLEAVDDEFKGSRDTLDSPSSITALRENTPSPHQTNNTRRKSGKKRSKPGSSKIAHINDEQSTPEYGSGRSSISSQSSVPIIVNEANSNVQSPESVKTDESDVMEKRLSDGLEGLIASAGIKSPTVSGEGEGHLGISCAQTTASTVVVTPNCPTDNSNTRNSHTELLCSSNSAFRPYKEGKNTTVRPTTLLYDSEGGVNTGTAVNDTRKSSNGTDNSPPSFAFTGAGDHLESPLEFQKISVDKVQENSDLSKSNQSSICLDDSSIIVSANNYQSTGRNSISTADSNDIAETRETSRTENSESSLTAINYAHSSLAPRPVAQRRLFNESQAKDFRLQFAAASDSLTKNQGDTRNEAIASSSMSLNSNCVVQSIDPRMTGTSRESMEASPKVASATNMSKTGDAAADNAEFPALLTADDNHLTVGKLCSSPIPTSNVESGSTLKMPDDNVRVGNCNTQVSSKDNRSAPAAQSHDVFNNRKTNLDFDFFDPYSATTNAKDAPESSALSSEVVSGSDFLRNTPKLTGASAYVSSGISPVEGFQISSTEDRDSSNEPSRKESTNSQVSSDTKEAQSRRRVKKDSLSRSLARSLTLGNSFTSPHSPVDVKRKGTGSYTARSLENHLFGALKRHSSVDSQRSSFDPNQGLFYDSGHYTTDSDSDSMSTISTDNQEKHKHEKERVRSMLADLGISDDILGLKEDHFATPDSFMGFTSKEELEHAIDSCKRLIKDMNEQSTDRQELIDRLIVLRIKLQEIKDTPLSPENRGRGILGHHFTKEAKDANNHFCDGCGSAIWGLFQSSYRCIDCSYRCHKKCLSSVDKHCVSQKASETVYIMDICPENGLGSQQYRCADCRRRLICRDGQFECRLCDYTGQMYCHTCHWNETMEIPARVIHNWDFTPRKVSRQSKHLLNLMLKKPIICIKDLNPALFNFVEELRDVRILREQILVMKSYLTSCRMASEKRMLLMLKYRQHFVESADLYSLRDLVDINSGWLLEELARIHAIFAKHIKFDCILCQGKAFICEICKSQEPIFPFDYSSIRCHVCRATFHRNCFSKDSCPRCKRLAQRQDLQTDS